MAKCKYRFMLKPKEQECIKHDCMHYMHLIGKDPQTGQDIDSWMCSDLAAIKLSLENAQQSRQAGAAIESFRNNMVKQNETFLGIVNAHSQNKKLR